jgi:hypothetical protein
MARVRQARRCRAHRRDGQPCKCYAIIGGWTCRAHGGTLPRVKQKARERALEAAAARTFGAYLRSPAYREHQDWAARVSDRPVIEALAERLARAEKCLTPAAGTHGHRNPPTARNP